MLESTMLVELIMYALVATFVAVVVLGHMLLAAAIIKCAREDLTGGRWMTADRRPLATRYRSSNVVLLQRSGAGWCPDSEVRKSLQHVLMRTSESKGH
jgi:hypothetical protein